MNPFETDEWDPKPCPYLKRYKETKFYFCTINDHKPKCCRSFEFSHRFCPIGISVLKLKTPEDIAERIDKGYFILNPKEKPDYFKMKL